MKGVIVNYPSTNNFDRGIVQLLTWIGKCHRGFRYLKEPREKVVRSCLVHQRAALGFAHFERLKDGCEALL